jgi:hypothetical protein
MEPMVVFSVGLIVYCGYLTIKDLVRDRQRCRTLRAEQVTLHKPRPQRKKVPIFSASRGRADGGDGHWPAPLKGSA